MSIIDTLITNRGNGAYYNVSDLNRVGEALEYLQNRLNNEYGFNLNLTIKTDWIMSDEPNQAQMDAYLQNVADIRTAINTVTEPPNGISNLTADGANDIEKILQEIETSLKFIEKSWFYSGEIYAGEV